MCYLMLVEKSHTYLHHIIANYNCLANVTLFVQGKVENHVHWRGDSDLTMYLKKARDNGFFAKHLYVYKSWGRIGFSDKWKKIIKNGEMRRTNMTMGNFWDTLFGFPHPNRTVWTSGAIFSVSRSNILLNPRKFYEKSISFLDHRNPEEGHYFERLWPAIFHYNNVP